MIGKTQQPSTPVLLCGIFALIVLAPASFAIDCNPACVNGNCNTSTGNCICPAVGFLNFVDTRCDNVSTITTGARPTSLSQTADSTIQSSSVSFVHTVFQGGFPISEGVIAKAVYICSNGYVTFDSDFCTTRIELLQTAAAPSFIAPFATSFDYRSVANNVSSTSSVTYELVTNVDAVSSISSLRNNFSEFAGTKSAIVITWNQMTPPMMDLNVALQQITTQLIIFTDMQKVTAAAILYSANTLKHYFDWLPTLVARKIGGSMVTLADKRSTAMAYANETVVFSGLKSRLRILQVYRNNATAPNYAAMCSSESLAARAITPSADVANSCPQTQQQAGSDPRYAPDPPPVAGKQAYKLVLTANIENVTQLTCVYHNVTGGLLVQESSITVMSNNVSLGANLYDYCCNKMTALCNLYYSKFPQPSSRNYRPPGSAGFVTGAGLFKTFDNFIFKFMGIGDYWLLNSANLKVQIRMENLNQPGANNSAAVSAMVAQFAGSSGLTIEVLSRNKSLISSWHYSINQSAYQNVTSTSSTQTLILNNVVIIGSSSRLLCYTQNSNSWIEILTGTNGLTVSVFLDKPTSGSIAGLLGNSDAKSMNDVAYRNGTVLNATQQMDQTLFLEAQSSWVVATLANESLFRVPHNSSNTNSGWSALYWNSVWDTNSTTLAQDLFAGNMTIYNASQSVCATKPSNSTEYRNCLLEYVDCQFIATCSLAYLARLQSTAAQIKDLSCGPPRWSSVASNPQSVKEGVLFSLNLTALVEVNATNLAFGKISGPSRLNVSENGSLTWVPAQGDVSSAIILSVSDRTTGCSSVLPLRVRITRRDGLCPTNAVESFGSSELSGITVTPQNQAELSSCVCNANYYGTNCTFPTCPLNCYSCGSPATNCSSTCPTNYDLSTIGSLTICAHRDWCNRTACSSPSSGVYTGCISADPAIQTESFKYQCVCGAGFQYPLSNPADKTKCEDINECLFPMYCDTAANKTCTNTAPGYTCACSPGFQLNNSSRCEDIDECKNNLTICQNGGCINTVGSYRCNCLPGFYAETSTKCVDIDECANPAVSKCTHRCRNNNGGFNCTCYDGFFLSNGSCTVIGPANSCTVNNCSYTNMCAKNGTVDTCYCLPGQTLNGIKTCTPTNHCTNGTCGTGTCSEIGSPSTGYSCKCSPDEETNAVGACVKKQYCTNPVKYPGVCPVGGNFVCSVDSITNAPNCTCSPGYRGNTTCVDINECNEANLCNPATTDCFNTIGSYHCICRFGYRRLNATHCTPSQHVYLVNGTFTDLTFSNGMSNYLSLEFNQTSDVLQKRFEASIPADSGSATLLPTIRIYSLSNGSVVAATVVSYGSPTTLAAIQATASSTGVKVAASSVVNQCANSTLNDCSTEHNCVEKLTGYMCQCKSGFIQTGIRAGYPPNIEIADCVDIDECLVQCLDGNKTCVNTPGSFSCSCVNGTYSPDPKTTRCDDPCVAGRCQNGGACQYQRSVQFPFKCICVAGYAGFNCELPDDNYIKMQRNAVIVGVVLGVLLLIALLIVVCCIIRKRQQPNKQTESNLAINLETREILPVPAHVPAQAPVAAVRNSEGSYKGVQTVPMAETSIPRAHESARHPSTYQNQAFERENTRQRNDYF